MLKVIRKNTPSPRTRGERKRPEQDVWDRTPEAHPRVDHITERYATANTSQPYPSHRALPRQQRVHPHGLHGPSTPCKGQRVSPPRGLLVTLGFAVGIARHHLEATRQTRVKTVLDAP